MSSLFASATLEHFTAQPNHNAQAIENVLTREAFAEAAAAIRQWEGYSETPLQHLRALAASCGLADILYKDEGPRFGLGSFKALGGSYAAQQLLQRELSKSLGEAVSLSGIARGDYREQAKDIHIVTATDGNHGRSVAWGCRQFGASCHIYIHAEVSQGRADAMASFGATVTRVDGNYDESVRAAQQAADDHGWFVVSDTSYEGYTQVPSQVMAGYGVLADEIIEQVGAELPTHLILQGGVGGLAASVAARLSQAWGKAAPRILIIEPDFADCLYQSARNGQLTEVDIQEETLMAGLSCGEPSVLAWQVLEATASDYLRMPDTLVAPAMWRLANPLGDDVAVEAGESAIPGISCLLACAEQPALAQSLGLDTNSRVLLIGSEGATDLDIYQQLVADGAY